MSLVGVEYAVAA